MTISRQVGSGGSEIARQVSSRLGFELLDRAGLEAQLPSYGLDEHELLELGGLPEDPGAWDDAELKLYLHVVNACISDLAERENLVLLGRGGQCLFADSEDALHVRVIGSEHVRLERLMEVEALPEPEAATALRRRGGFRSRYVKMLFGRDIENPALYDVTLRRDRLDIDASVQMIVQAFGQRSLRIHSPRVGFEDDSRFRPKAREADAIPKFANETEEAFAQLLDYYHIRWAYEPTTFPLAFNEEGMVSEAFAPDFYLTDYDTYIELTTLRQSLVTKKNRKLRRLKEVYPSVNVRLFYRKDYEQLLLKYGVLRRDADHPNSVRKTSPK